jgi:hypothetical protein
MMSDTNGVIQWVLAALVALIGLFIIAALLAALGLPRVLVWPTIATVIVIVGVPVIIVRTRRKYFG